MKNIEVRKARLVATVMISTLLFVLGWALHDFSAQKAKKTGIVEAANPPAIVTCPADIVLDCTLTVVVPEKNEKDGTCPVGNYDTMLSGEYTGARLYVYFSCDPLTFTAHHGWSYGPNDLSLADGRPVELSEVKHVRAIPPGFIGQNIHIGPFDVIDDSPRR